ncbi:MAG: DUF512 domain-containing protein [Dissulfurispiraceae bacterium]
MKSNQGVEIEEIIEGSIAEKKGLLPGDRLIAINGHAIRDSIDLMFYTHGTPFALLVQRKKERLVLEAQLDRGCISDLGIMLKHFKVKTCKNRCLFCFVSQLPRGLRKSLYLKDEDYRMSFLYGNYVTLTNLSDDDKKRIVEQRLSPLYISVHSTDTRIRNEMIGNPKAADISGEIRFFAENKIKMHSQIVLCPGYNGGKILAKTISDLYRFYPYIMSIAVVPVGLTVHRKRTLNPVEKQDAIDAVQIIQAFQSRFKRKHGEHVVYAADELYLKADMQFPPMELYDDLPQIENGVGMVPQFIHQSKRIKIPQVMSKNRLITFTGTSFYPYLLKFTERIKRAGVDMEVLPIENTLFGKSITVAGLLSGRDVMKTCSGILRRDDILLIPDVVMRECDQVFLDDVSRQDLEEVIGTKTVVIESTPKGLVDAIAELA